MDRRTPYQSVETACNNTYNTASKYQANEYIWNINTSSTVTNERVCHMLSCIYGDYYRFPLGMYLFTNTVAGGLEEGTDDVPGRY